MAAAPVKGPIPPILIAPSALPVDDVDVLPQPANAVTAIAAAINTLASLVNFFIFTSPFFNKKNIFFYN